MSPLSNRNQRCLFRLSAALLLSTALLAPTAAQTTHDVRDTGELDAALAAAAAGDTVRFDPAGLLIVTATPLTATNAVILDGNGGTWQSQGQQMLLATDFTAIRNITFSGASTFGTNPIFGGAINIAGSIAYGIAGSTFTNNSAIVIGDGGSIEARGVAVYVGGDFNGGITSSAFIGNSIGASSLNSGITNSRIETYGGAISTEGKLTGGITGNSTFTDNSVRSGAFSASNAEAYAFGGAVFTGDSFEGGIGNSSHFIGNKVAASARTEMGSASSYAYGGALYISGQLAGGITGNSIFTDNSATTTGTSASGNVRTLAYGGAIKVLDDLAGGISSSTFTGNSAAATVSDGPFGAEAFAHGGAIHVGTGFAGGIIDSAFIGNRTTAIASNETSNALAFAQGGAIHVGTQFTDGIANSTFASNSASATVTSENSLTALTYGGALFVGAAFEGGITGSSFTGNSASAMATGAGNRAVAVGGAILIGGDFDGGIGGSIFSNNSTSTTATGNGSVSAEGRGAAVYVGGVFDGGISGSTFSGNTVAIRTTSTADARGGSIHVRGAFTGDISGSAFSGNTVKIEATSSGSGASAKAYGGAIYVNGTFTGDISDSTFSGNAASTAVMGGSSASAEVQGGAIFVMGDLKGSIGNSAFTGNTLAITTTSGWDNNAEAHGGAISVGGDFTGGISGSAFNGNRVTASAVSASSEANASAQGGALHFGGTFTGDINGSAFRNNSATASAVSTSGTAEAYAYGGALFVNNAFTGAIRDSVFIGNHADTAGGALFLNTINSTTPHDIVLTSSEGGLTQLSGNTDASGANSLFFGRTLGTGDSRQSPRLTLTGAGSLMLLDPIGADINNGHTLTIVRDTSDGNGRVTWGGANRLTVEGGVSAAFAGGATTLTETYSLIAGPGTPMQVSFGQDHVLSLQFAGRDGTLAFLDYTGGDTGASSLTIAPGSTISLARTLLSYSGHYLFANGISISQAEADNFNFGNTAYLQASVLSEPEHSQIWIDATYDPYIDKGPNARRAQYALDQWLRFTGEGLSLSDAGFNSLLANLDSAAPEAAMTLGFANSRIHDRAVDAALAGMTASTGPAPTGSVAGVYMADPGTRAKPAAVAPEPPAVTGWRLWASYIGSFQRADNSRGYSGYDTDANGILAGATLAIDRNWAVGAYAGYSYSETDFKHLHANADTDGGHFGLIGRYATDFGLKLTLDAAYSSFSNDLTRHPGLIGTTKATFDQDVWSIGATAAYDLKPWQNGRLTPFAGIRRTWLDQDGFRETGGPLAAWVRSASLEGLATTLGAELAHDFTLAGGTTLTPSLSLAWRHEFGDRQMSALTGFTAPLMFGGLNYGYDVYSRPLSRDSARVGIGLDAAFGPKGMPHWNLKAVYNLDAYSKATEHSGFVKAEYRF